jgi:hypothetical protein
LSGDRRGGDQSWQCEKEEVRGKRERSPSERSFAHHHQKRYFTEINEKAEIMSI